jgi:hypothetical protein
VSQDGEQLYIAMAVRNDRHQEFLLDINEPDNEEGFLLIRQWGPWYINLSKDVHCQGVRKRDFGGGARYSVNPLLDIVLYVGPGRP